MTTDPKQPEPSPFRTFGGMCWPVPCERVSDVARSLAWPFQQPDDELMRRNLVAASVMNAYTELIRLPQRERNKIIAELRKGPGHD